MERSSVDQHVFKRLQIPITSRRSELEKAQRNLLRETIRHAMNCTFYTKKYGEYNPETIQTMSDLQKLPLIDSDDIRQNGHTMLCISQSMVTRVVTLHTSGSTGTPKRLFSSEQDIQATLEFFYTGMKTLIGELDRVLVLLPWEQPDSVGELLIRALHTNGIHAEGMWPPDLSTAGSEYIRKQKLTCLAGLPQHLLALSHSLGKGVIHSMLLCSDYASPTLRQQIEKNCGCETFLHYGSTESGLGGGVECALHNGCHLRESEVLLEVIDPLTGKQQPDNIPGELVLTTLGREAMPLIRYRTGDWGALTYETCACGGITARITALTGRMNGCQLAGGGILLSSELDDLLYNLPGLLDYRATLDLTGNMDQLNIVYTSDAGANDLEAGLRTLLSSYSVFVGDSQNMLQLGDISQVKSFGADHTIKRMISDVRNLARN